MQPGEDAGYIFYWPQAGPQPSCVSDRAGGGPQQLSSTGGRPVGSSTCGASGLHVGCGGAASAGNRRQTRRDPRRTRSARSINRSHPRCRGRSASCSEFVDRRRAVPFREDRQNLADRVGKRTEDARVVGLGPVLVTRSDDALAAAWIASSCACSCVVCACICMVCSRKAACL